MRSYPDGTVEVRTVENGAFRRYHIQEDGASTLVESVPRTWRYAGSIGLCWLGLLLAFGAFLALVGGADDFWAAMMVVAGLVIFVVGMALTPYGKPPQGERWVSIGGPTE